MNTYSIFLTERAEEELYNTLEYLSQNWSAKELTKFANRVDQALEKIRLNPITYPLYSKSVRKFVIDKNNIVFYQLEGTQVQVLSIWATKRNLKK